MAKRRISRVPVKLEAAGDTDIGGRSHNEDSILLRPDLNLFIVADGAGGQNAGNVASSIATTTVAHFFEQTKPGADKLPDLDSLGLPTAARRLSAAVHEANKEILAIAEGSDRHRGMGTTIVAALFALDRRWVHIAQVGDSRCYRFRDDRLELLTRDHCIATDVLELRPDIDDAVMATLPKNCITRALGMQTDLRVSMRTRSFAHGDRYLLCSDGLSDVVDHEQIAEVLGLDAEVDELVRLLLNMALEAGASDNVAMALIDCSVAGAHIKTATRPFKKLTPSPMPKVADPKVVRPRLDTITEENAPEILLFRDGHDRESAPMIHVVPLQSGTQEVLDAVAGVMAPDSAPPPAMAPPAMPAAAKRRKEKPSPATADSPTKKAAGPDKHDSGRYAIIEGVASAEQDEPDEDFNPRLTRAMDPLQMDRVGGAKKAPTSQRYSAPRRNGASSSVLDEPARSGNTAAPPGPILDYDMGDLSSPKEAKPEPDDAEEEATGRAATPPPVRSKQQTDAGPKPRLNLPTQARKRKSRPKAPAVHERRPIQKPPTKPQIKDVLPDPPVVEPPITPGRGGTTPGLAPVPPLDEPPREAFDTSEFVGEDNVPCHACGSIISRISEHCMYCGAETGFVTK